MNTLETFERLYEKVRRRKRLIQAAVLAAMSALFVVASIATEFYPERLVSGLPNTAGFFERLAPHLEPSRLFADERQQGSLLYWYHDWDVWIRLLLESVEMAVLATMLGGTAALFGSFFAAANIAPRRAVAFAVRRTFELLRTIPDIVMALIFVYAFGIGPLAGILAIALHTTGALGKLMTEINENVDMRPIEGIGASGGSWSQTVRFGVLPQILPAFASYAMLRFEINVAGAAAIGIVGAGGIGQEYVNAISFGYFEDVGAILLLIVLLVFTLDLASEAVRRRLGAAERAV